MPEGTVSGVPRATTLVLIGLAAVGAASALATKADTDFGDVRALCLVERPLLQAGDSWPDPGFEPEPQRDFAFLDKRVQTALPSMAVVDSATGAVVWTTVQGEHRAVPASALSDQLQQNVLIQVALECSATRPAP